MKRYCSGSDTQDTNTEEGNDSKISASNTSEKNMSSGGSAWKPQDEGGEAFQTQNHRCSEVHEIAILGEERGAHHWPRGPDAPLLPGCCQTGPRQGRGPRRPQPLGPAQAGCRLPGPRCPAGLCRGAGFHSPRPGRRTPGLSRGLCLPPPGAKPLPSLPREEARSEGRGGWERPPPREAEGQGRSRRRPCRRPRRPPEPGREAPESVVRRDHAGRGMDCGVRGLEAPRTRALEGEQTWRHEPSTQASPAQPRDRLREAAQPASLVRSGGRRTPPAENYVSLAAAPAPDPAPLPTTTPSGHCGWARGKKGPLPLFLSNGALAGSFGKRMSSREGYAEGGAVF
ncbi:uncharacterized protein LOC144455454 [Phascolarctos cinereus]